VLPLTRRLRRVASNSTTAADLLRDIGRGELSDRLASAQVPIADLLAVAAHEAALVRHPYVGIEHVEVAAYRMLRESDLVAEGRRDLLGLKVSRHRWWRVRGRRSALRSAGQADLDQRQRQAREADD